MDREKELIAAGLLTLVAFALFIGLFTIQQRTSSIIGPRFMPIIVIIALLTCAMIIALSALRIPKSTQDIQKKGTDQKNTVEKLSIMDLIFDRYASVVMWGVLVAYAFCLKPLGFILSSVALVFILCLLLAPKNERHYVKFFILALVSSVIIYFVFVKLFLLILPKGILSAIL